MVKAFNTRKHFGRAWQKTLPGKKNGQGVGMDFHKPEVKWFVGGKLNITENCIDRHLPKGPPNRHPLGTQRS